MSIWVFIIFIVPIFTPSQTHILPTDQSFISLLISHKGIDFVKQILIFKSASSLRSLNFHKIHKIVKIPLVGDVRMVLSNITIHDIDVPSSYVEPGDTGISIIASGVICNLSFDWSYAYNSWPVPITISDHGKAYVQVEDLEARLTLGLKNQDGNLKVLLKECGSYIKNISIKLDGGASWLYQGVLDAFEAEIRLAVGTSITKNLKQGISKLDSFLQSLPKEIPVDKFASLNITFVNEPILSNFSVGFEINGLFTTNNNSIASGYYQKNSEVTSTCDDPSQMLGISVDEAVLNSASCIYFNAECMQWVVDKLPDQTFLNTAGWRFIVPQLYKKYPNDDMKMNITLCSPPVIEILHNRIDATIYSDFVIDVLEANEVIPVACISLVIRASGTVQVLGNNLAGNVKLNDFTMALKWSEIGNLRMYLIQTVVWSAVETVLLPNVNSHLGHGFPLPVIYGFILQNAKLTCTTSTITICSDAKFVGFNSM